MMSSGNDIPSLVAETMESHQLTRHQPLVVAVSGGPDSMVLLHILVVSLQFRVITAHVNYGKRGEASDADQGLVSSWCSRHDIPVKIYDARNHPKITGDTGNFQDHARRVRQEFLKSVMQDNNAGGIAVSTLIGGGCFVIVEDNFIENNRYGYAAIGSNIHSKIFNNHLIDNNIQGVPNLGGSGLNFNGGATNTAIVSGNIISGNLWGVTIQGQAMPNLGDVNSPASPGGNHLFDNGNTGQLYALYNNTPQNQMAQNNYWGFTSIDSVEMVIFHQPDDPSLGFVNYIPILNPILAGDANCDGTVNVVDIITIANYIMGQNPEPFCFENADVNQDDAITVMDIIGTANIIMGEAMDLDFKELKKE